VKPFKVFGIDYEDEEYVYGEGEYDEAEQTIDWFEHIEGIWEDEEIEDYLFQYYPEQTVIEIDGGKIVVFEDEEE